MVVHIYICFVEVFLGNYRLSLDQKWEIIFDVWDLENIQLNIRITSQIVQKFAGELKSQGKLIF